MKYLLFFIAVFFAVETSAQDPYYWQLTDEDGLPSMTVYNIQQDSKGYMWVGTAAGLCRYDGRDFEYYRHPEQLDDEIMQLKIDAFDRVWYSNLAGQLFYIETGEIIKSEDFGFEEGYKMHRIYTTREGKIILTCNRPGKELKNKGRLVVISVNKDSITIQKTLTLDGEIKNGYTNESNFFFYIITIPSVPSMKFLDFNELVIELSDELFSDKLIQEYQLHHKGKSLKGGISILLNKDKKILHFSGLKVMCFNFFEPNSKIKHIDFSFAVSSILEVEEQYWIFTKEGGIHIFDPDKFSFIGNYFSPGTLNQGYLDCEGNIWIATNTEGVRIIPNEKFSQIRLNSNQINSSIDALFPTLRKGTVLASSKESVFEIENRILKRQIPLKNVSKIRAFTSGNGSSHLVGTDNAIIEINNNGRTKHLNSIPIGLKDISIDQSGNFYFGNFANCYQLNLKDLEKHLSISHLSELDKFSVLNQRTYAIYPDIENNTWIGTDKGLYKYENNKAEPFLENGTHHPYRYSSIVQSPYDSTVWAATHGNGILRIKNDEVIAHYTEDSLLISNICNDLFADDYGNVWAATNQGLQKFNLKNKRIELINKYDGLPSDEITQVAVADNIVYAGTNKGLITFSLDAKTRNEVAPPVHITNVAVFEKDTTLSGEYDLTYEQNSLRIDFVGLAYKCRGNVRYKYRMAGIDTNWISTNTRVARFLGLAPGDYEFQVLALNEDGVESIAPATVKFNIHPPFWQTWWFRLLAGAALTGIVAAIFYARYRQVRNREKREYEFQNQLNDLRGQALQAQMNPHFIFNSMNAIQHFLTTNDQENAMIYLARFAKLIRHIFDQSKEKTITLARELDFLTLYVSLEKLRFQNKINVQFDVSNSVEEAAEEIEIPPLLIQPIIENAFKHGLFHKKSEGNLLIQFTYKDDILKCIVEDDGIGRKRSEEINKWKRRNHKSSGLNSTAERIHLLNTDNSSLNKEQLNDIKITDLFDAEGNPTGTSVEINFKCELGFD